MMKDMYEDYAWTVWQISAEDPRPGSPDFDALIEPSLAQAAAGLGCDFDMYSVDAVFVGPVETDIGVHSWYVRVPRDQYMAGGPPQCVRQLVEHLRTLVPSELGGWSAQVHGDFTVRHELDALFKEEYADLITPLEAALLGMRRDGAQEMNPQTYLWHGSLDGGPSVATYTMWLGRDPDYQDRDTSAWLHLQAGFLPRPAFQTTPAAQKLAKYQFAPATPLLLMPRPDTGRWVARLSSPSIGNATVAPLWSAATGPELAERVACDLQLLLLGWDMPGQA
jgi:hypothetical protein